MNSFEKIELIRKSKGYCILSLIDPDCKNDKHLSKLIQKSNSSFFDGILVGGSNISDDKFEDRIKIINEKSKLPLLLFPGSFNQITPQVKTVLYLNLISGRNPKYLIEEHVKGAMKIQKYSIFTVPTAYILLDGGNTTSVQKVSKTEPLNMSDTELVLSHALAGQYLGNKLIYFDCGSGAKKSMMPSLVKYISDNVNIPIMIGGGIKSKETIDKLVESGASYVIIGNFLESSKSDKLFN